MKKEPLCSKNLIVGQKSNKSTHIFKMNTIKNNCICAVQRQYITARLVSRTSKPISFMFTELELPVFVAHLVLWFNKSLQLFTGKVVTIAALDFKYFTFFLFSAINFSKRNRSSPLAMWSFPSKPFSFKNVSFLYPKFAPLH